ncbi:hypothetical protein C1646_680043 [Rhizophagus diaphanus]|nr:hypothetical protein C1646_680043 [Rhizophagus diaphanus] [Rhizophagus sp. MUCL 43196]
MNSAMMTTSKSSSKSSSYNESSFIRSRASSLSVNNSDSQIFSQQYNPRILLSASFNYFEEEELGAPINIYHENRGRLEEDKKARTELDTDILNNDLYCPVQQQETETSTSRGLNIGKFTSFLPRFSFSNNNNYGGIMDSTSTNIDSWGYHHSDMFNTNNMFDGINDVVCK